MKGWKTGLISTSGPCGDGGGGGGGGGGVWGREEAQLSIFPEIHQERCIAEILELWLIDK